MPNWNFNITAKTFPAIALVLGVFLIVIQQIGWGIVLLVIAVGSFVVTS
jgi:hypothetical protein